MESKNLTVDDWLDHALAELQRAGYGALRAQPLAKSLGVTRGSFYYHFESLEAFHRAVVAQWAKRTSGPLIADLSTGSAPDAALRKLLQITLRSGAALERAMRAWATVEAHVAEAVDAVDQTRIGFADDLLQKAGVPASEAVPRARLLYWAAIGRLMMPFPDQAQLSHADIDALADLMLSTAAT